MKAGSLYSRFYALLIFIGMQGLVCHAASSSSSSSSSSTEVALPATADYYSVGNFQRIIQQNAERVKRGELPTDVHAPAVIFADPADDEGVAVDTNQKAFTLSITDLICSDFNPIIILSASSFESLIFQDDQVLRDMVVKKYHVLAMRLGQLVVLVPRWYYAAFGGFYGFDTQDVRELGHELTNREIWDIWLLSKRCFRGSSLDERKRMFIQDLQTIFAQGQDAQAPVWDIFFMGHGIYKSSGEKKRVPYIGGLSRAAFMHVLRFFNTNIKVGAVYVDSCFAGGSNARFVDKMIGSWQQPLNFDLIFATIGEAVIGTSIMTDPAAHDDTGPFDPLHCAVIQAFFNDAAQLAWKRVDGHYKENIKKLMKHQLMSRAMITGRSLYGNEAIAQIRPRFGKRVKFLRDLDPSIAVVDAKKSADVVVHPGRTSLVLAATPEISHLTLAPTYVADGWKKTQLIKEMIELNKKMTAYGKAGDDIASQDCLNMCMKIAMQIPTYELLYCLYQVSLERVLDDQGVAEQLSTLKYPELIPVLHQKRIDQPIQLHIHDLSLESENAYAGIHKFFMEAFLATLLYSVRHVIIDRLSGPNDIALFCTRFKKLKSGKFSESSGIFDTDMPLGERITLTDVHVTIFKKSMQVDFIFSGHKYFLMIDFVQKEGETLQYKIRKLYEVAKDSETL